VGSGART
jgi:NAD(P)-dependent dehydrogenase (short-subunit alcohol dehydrogenase family)